jgi:hypothetical protein
MNKENQLRRGILASVSVNKIDLRNPNNAFTIWTATPGGETFCGGRATLQDARALARQYVHVKNLVMLPADPTKDLVPIADSDRDQGTPRPPSSGNDDSGSALPLKSKPSISFRLLGRKCNYTTPEFVARFDEFGESRQSLRLLNETIAVQHIYVPNEFGIICTRCNHDGNMR